MYFVYSSMTLINGYRLRGYIDRKKLVVNFNWLIWTLFISKFVHPVGRQGNR